MAFFPVSSTDLKIPPPVDPLRQASGQLTGALPFGNHFAAQAGVPA
jgi:hypothetical protein